MVPGVSAASGPTPMAFSPILTLPALVTTLSGTERKPGYAGLKVMGTVHTVPAGFEVKPSAAHPVILPTVYSCLFPCEAEIVKLVMVSAWVVCRNRFCGALLLMTAVEGKVRGDTSRMTLLEAS